VLVINESLARRDFPGENPVGKMAYLGRDSEPWQIAGIVQDVRQFGLDRTPSRRSSPISASGPEPVRSAMCRSTSPSARSATPSRWSRRSQYHPQTRPTGWTL